MRNLNLFIKNTIKLFFVCCIVFTITIICRFDAFAGEVNFHAVYVGRGDAIIINSGDHYMLIDSGTSDGAPLLLKYLRKLNIPENKIEYVVSTHPDGDHVGGFSDVFEEYDIGQVYYSPCTKAFNVYSEFIDCVKKEGCPFKNPIDGESWKLGDATVTVVYDGSQGSTYNECSIVLKITCDGKSFLLTGDLPSTMERQLMGKGYNFKADVLKIGHHGAAASSCAKFLDAVNADYAVISASKSKNSLLPKPSVLKRLARRFVKTYRTTDGNILIKCKNGKISTNNKENNGYISIKKGKITLSNNVFYAKGKEIKPKVTLNVNGAVVSPSQYKIKYSSNKHTGFGKVKLYGTETKYVSTCSAYFMILPEKESLGGTLHKFNTIKLNWSPQSHATGYNIKYSTDKKMKKNVKRITYKNSQILSRVIDGLEFNKKYYFQIRAYKSNIGNGKWSKTVVLKTKKAPKPDRAKISSIEASGKTSLSIKWKKLSKKYGTGYMLQYSTDKNFKDSKKVKRIKIKNYKKTKLTIKNLKKKGTYYVRVRSFNKYCNGRWSSVEKVKLK